MKLPLVLLAGQYAVTIGCEGHFHSVEKITQDRRL